MKQRYLELLLAFIVITIGSYIRLDFAQQTDWVIDSDEAIVGLMAKHINKGQGIPTFYYGQPYMGSLEAISVALSFKLFGQDNFALKVVPIFYSIIHLSLIFILALEIANFRVAIIATLLTAIAPVALIQWSNMARGGFIELVVIGTFALFLTVKILKTPNYFTYILLGLTCGLGWWINNQMIFYLVPIFLTVATFELNNSSIKEATKRGIFTLIAFFVGGAPFWIYNLKNKWSTFEFLTRAQGKGNALSHLQGLLTESLPILVGARKFWSTEDLFSYSSDIGYFILTLPLIFLILNKQVSIYIKSLFILFLISLIFFFSISEFGWLSQAPRYLLPYYSVGFIILALPFVKKEINFFETSLFSIIIILQLCLSLKSTFGEDPYPGQPFVFEGERVSLDQSELYDWLKEKQYNHIRTNYWIGYRTAFETNEAITFSQIGQPKTVRIKNYEDNKSHLIEAYPLVLTRKESYAVKEELEGLNFLFDIEEKSNYRIIHNIRRKYDLGEKYNLKPDDIVVSSRDEWKMNMVDGDENTRWGTSDPQKPGMYVELKFKEPVELTAIDLDLGDFLQDEPRGLQIKGCLAEICEILSEMKPNSSAKNVDLPTEWLISFKPTKVDHIKINQTGYANPFDWSIAELRLYHPKY